MKKYRMKSQKLIVFLGIMAIILAWSCKEEKVFDYSLVESHSDGIQNLGEEGIDCGGPTGVDCPTCEDGIQNQGEEGIDCGGPCATPCPIETPRYDSLIDGALPYFHTFEQDFAGRLMFPDTINTTATVILGADDPSGEEGIVGEYTRSAGKTDLLFEAFDNSISFLIFKRYTLDVFVPEETDISGALEPTVEVFFYSSNDSDFESNGTKLSASLSASDAGSWVTVELDGSSTLTAGGMDYNSIAIRIGGSGSGEGTFYIRNFLPVVNFGVASTPRFDALQGSGFPFYHTFESDESGHNLAVDTENGTVIVYTGADDPAGGTDLVGVYNRPEGNVSDGFSDLKFLPFESAIDFSTYKTYSVDVYVPSELNDFTSNLTSDVELIFFDASDATFWNTWTVILASVSPGDFDKWVTITWDGSESLPGSVDYTGIALRIGGSGHEEPGVFLIKDFVPVE